MIIRKPIHTTPHDNYSLTRLHFERDIVIPFYMRGSIAFPEGHKEGFAIMAGKNIRDKRIYIFEQFSFWTIDHWIDERGQIKRRENDNGYHIGLVQFLLDNKSKYKSTSYFYGGQHIDIHTRHRVSIYRNKLTPSNIHTIEVDYVNENGESILQEAVSRRLFRADNGSPLHASVSQWLQAKGAGIEPDNRILAIKILLCGFNKFPFRDNGQIY